MHSANPVSCIPEISSRALIMLRRRLFRRWVVGDLPLSVSPPSGPLNPAISFSGLRVAVRAGAAAGDASAAAASKSPQASTLLISLSAPLRRALVRPHAAASRGVFKPWCPLHKNFCRGLCSQTNVAADVAAAAAAAVSVGRASIGAAATNKASAGAGGGTYAGRPLPPAAPEAADAACLESGVDLVQVDIKRDQQRFLQMLGPLREALLARIAACAPQEEANALRSYYSRVIDYNCTGGKLLRGLLTVYASLAANREVQFLQPSDSAAGAAAAAPTGVADAAPAAAAAAARATAAPAFAAVISSPATAVAAAAATAAGRAAAAAAPLACGSGSGAAGAAAVEDAFASGACVLGWGVELLQAAFLVADDQMDGAYTRRGKVCWYRRQEVGAANAINDAVFLIYAIHQVLREFLGKHPASSACSDLLQDVAFKTVLGQHLDSNGGVHTLLLPYNQQQQQQQQQQVLLRVLREGSAAATATLKQLTAAARSRQQAAARLKTSYYSFWLPTALGLLYSGVCDRSLLTKAEEICLCTGDYFQAQDDFLDCFGCPDALGKLGTDIREGKCSWLFVEALAAATPAEAAELLEAYGRVQGEGTVRELYVHLKVQERFKDYENGACEKILRLVDGLEHPGLQSYFVALLQLLHRRPQ